MNTSKINTTSKRWLSPDDLFEEYGIGKSNQAKMRMRRKIPFCKVGRYIRYDRHEIDRWIESNKVEMAS